MKKTWIYSGSFLFLLGLSSCYYDVASELYPDENCNTPAVVNYAANVKLLIDSRCASSGCHVAGGNGPGDFSNSATAIAAGQDGSIEARSVVQRDMPPSQPLSNCEIALLEAWIAQGAN
ncbi:MAG: hypothetical protein SGI87_00635 [Flavobacteriales bacterium]|nr:hypothetical protein [Flavobacteriales bacterium]